MPVRRIIKIFYFVVAWPIRQTVAWFFTFLAFDVFRFRRQDMIDHFKIAFPEIGAAQRTQILRRSIWLQWTNLIEFLRIPSLDENWLRQETVWSGFENLDQALQQKKGVLVLSLHLGNPDFATTALSLKGYRVSLISKFFSNSVANRFWFALRGRGGTQYIDPHGPQTAFAILKALRANRLVIFVADQFLGAPYGVTATFFGKKCGTPIGLSVFYKKTQCPVLPIWTVQGTDGKTHMYCGPTIDYAVDHQSKDQFYLSLTELYNRELERIIALHPEQWLWLHRRWKREL